MAQTLKPKRKYNKSKQPPNLRRKVRPVKSFKQPPPSLFRRILRLIFNPITFGIVAFSLLGIFLIATYFWFEFSPKIDLMLSGEVFTQSAGIYSAPKTLKRGEKISKDELVEYLKSAGYVKKERKADVSRSRYEVV
ncbi:MAG: hypothetical protein ACR2J3_03870, partial [Aridibacter sp.]